MATLALWSKAHHVMSYAWRQSARCSLCSAAIVHPEALPQDCLKVDVFPAARSRTTSVGQDPKVLPQSSPGKNEKPERAVLQVLTREEHGLYSRLISPSTWLVLRNLKDAGHETYLVGGSVRDLILKRIPKDFDILCTAELGQVKKRFPGRCQIVGRRFPICIVRIQGTEVEVSSFSTNLGRRKPRNTTGERVEIDGTAGWDARDFARWENSKRRDFTVNSLIYDPFKELVYDYVGGLRDLARLRVRTVFPADRSFKEDSARILRAIRIAARLGFKLSKRTAQAVKIQRFSVLKINRGRLIQEVNYLFSYGAAEPTLRLLWRYGVLDLLFPLQANFLVKLGFQRRDVRSNLLLDLLRNLDKAVAPDRPCHGSLWVAVLAFHLAVFDGKTSPVGVATAALKMYYTENTQKALEEAKQIHLERPRLEATDGTEGSAPTLPKDKTVLKEAALLIEKAKSCLNQMSDSTEAKRLVRTLAGTEHEGVLAVGQVYSSKAYRIFMGGCQEESKAPGVEEEVKGIGKKGKFQNLSDPKQERKKAGKKEKKTPNPATPEAITNGDLCALRYLFSRIVLNTLYPRADAKH